MQDKPKGFMTYGRQPTPQRDPRLRLNDFYEIYGHRDEPELRRQGARCMDCGIPFCQSGSGCPIDNLIPEWNDLVYQDQWRAAYERLILTNNFPEFTGRVCPAPCEHACVLGIHEPAVTIKSIECAIIDKAFEEGWVIALPPKTRTGKRVAVVGSGPAGLAAADELNKAGHAVTVFERDNRIGGLLMYGIPNMKLDKRLVDRRVNLLRAQGVEFVTRAHVGRDIPTSNLRSEFDALILACGALQGRDLYIPGRHLRGVHMAMDYLKSVTQTLLTPGSKTPGSKAPGSPAEQWPIDAAGKHVVVIGGGDTGADCIGTALRQGCKSILNITRREREPDQRDDAHPWPGPPGTYVLDYSHKEGQALFGRDPREYGVQPMEFVGDETGQVRAIRVQRLRWDRQSDGRFVRQDLGSVENLPADLILLAIGFTGHDAPEIVQQLGLQSEGGVIWADDIKYTTPLPGVFAAGDMRRGASLVVWAIREGRGAAHACDRFLMGPAAAK